MPTIIAHYQHVVPFSEVVVNMQLAISFINYPVPDRSGTGYCLRSIALLGRPEPRSGRAYILPVMFFFRHAFSETPQPIALKLFHMIRIWLYFIN